MVHYERLLEIADPETHIAQFYGADERPLVRNLSLYLGTGLQRGDNHLVVVTAERREAVLRQLTALRADVAGALSREQLVVLDAAETLSLLMADGQPDAGAFERVIASLVRQLHPGPGRRRLRVYGEMVDLLWRRRQFSAALRLEELWNQLRETQDFQLFCAYGIDFSDPEFPSEAARQVVCAHTHVISPATGVAQYAGPASRDGAGARL